MEVTDLGLLAGPAAASTLEAASLLVHAAPLVVRPPRHVPHPLVMEAAATLRRAPTVTVVVGDPGSVDPALARAADVCLTDHPDAAGPWVTAPVPAVVEAVRAAPEAALALVSLLRTSEGLDVHQAIAAEAATYALLLGSAPHRRWRDRRGPARPRAPVRPPVAVERSDDVLTVRLDRPEARNAIDTPTRDTLVAALELVAADPSIRAVHLRGTGPCFSAGGDLHEFGTTTDPATSFAVRLTRHPGAAVHRVAARTTAHLHGSCIGAGLEIPAFAGRVIATPEATFRLPELAMGLVPGAGGTVSLPRRIGRHRAAWLALTGTTLDAPTARAWGLVDTLVGDQVP